MNELPKCKYIVDVENSRMSTLFKGDCGFFRVDFMEDADIAYV